jgi:hypothetical protein
MKQLLTDQSGTVLRQYYRRQIPAGTAGPTTTEVPDSSVPEELVLDESSIGVGATCVTYVTSHMPRRICHVICYICHAAAPASMLAVLSHHHAPMPPR